MDSRPTAPPSDVSESALFQLWKRGRGGLPLRRVLLGYATATALCLAVLLIRLSIGYEQGDPPMLVLYMIPVVAASCIGGLLPGLYCTALGGLLAAYYLAPPLRVMAVRNLDDLFNLATMVLTGTVISLLVETMHRLRRNAELSLDRYRIVADNTYDWEFWIDPEGKSVYQSPSCERITGHGAEEFLADPERLEGIVHPDDLPLFKAHRHGVVEGQSPGALDFRIIRPDGEIRWIEHFCQPVFGSDGAYLGARGSNSDVTDRKRLEEVMILTEKMMSVGGLAAGMAHEINNPLGGVLQNLQNVRRRLSPDLATNAEAALEQGCTLEAVRNYLQARQIFEFLDAIEASGKQAARIVSNMLDFSRASASGMIPQDINEIARNALARCLAVPGEKLAHLFEGIRIEEDLDPGEPTAPCVPAQIERALMNLLVNAAQALKQNPSQESPAIVLRTRGAGDGVRIEVQDNGPGMEPDVLKRAFDPFFTTKPPGSGAGLGLSVSYFIVANHKGTLKARSAPGQGATFTVELKAA